jgi:hypothetical protein
MTAEAYMKSKDHLTISFANGETTTVYPTNPRYNEIIEALNAKQFEKARKLAVPVAAVKAKIEKVTKRGVKNVELKAGVVYYNDKPIHNTLTDRIVAMANEGFDIEPMCNFLSNLQQNPSFRAVNELYGFLEKGKLPITEDGHFLSYKRVRNNYTDCYTGTMSNAIGTVVEMERNQVNEDPKQTCSAGLHFCSREYLQHFGNDSGNRTVILKINPADVVAIPADYNDTKGRTCRYEVIGELEHKNEKPLEGSFQPSDNYKAPVDDEDEYDFDDEQNEFDNDQVATAAAVESDDNNECPIEAIDTSDGEVIDCFHSVEEAAKWAMVTPSAIRRVLKGDRKSTGGYGWKDASAKPADPTAPHPTHLANLHEHGTLKGGRPHHTQLDADMNDDDEDFGDDIPY